MDVAPLHATDHDFGITSGELRWCPIRKMWFWDEQLKALVEGYVFRSIGDHSDRNGYICKIIGREQPDADDLGPLFRVRFGDGYETYAYSEELHPWYMT